MLRGHYLLLAVLGSLHMGCAPGSPAKAPKPRAPGDAPAGSDPASPNAKQQPQGPAADQLYPALAAVPQPSANCPAGAPLAAQASCTDAREKLGSALAEADKSRDGALSSLETCTEFPRGLIRALRAELGDAACADELVQPVVGSDAADPGLSGDIRETLVALGLGARLRRLAMDPPQAPTDQKKEALEAYFQKDLFPWIQQQAEAIFVMASQGTKLSGYARGVVATEAGNADMRFVEIARNVPLAAEIAAHPEAKDLYYATLDEQLEPRKVRGRNAALVGLREMSRAGVRSSDRLTSARSLLSRAYGGRRVNALDTLLVEPLAPQKAVSASDSIASRVPTPYATSLVGPALLTALLVRAHLQMGMPEGLRRQIEADGDPSMRLLLARSHFEAGKVYFQAASFQAVKALLTPLVNAPAPAAGAAGPQGAASPTSAPKPTLTPSEQDDARLLLALSLALLSGPQDAAALILQGPRFTVPLGELEALDLLAAEKSALGGRAQFNAAYLRELVITEGAPDAWALVSAMYMSASQKLSGSERSLAKDRGLACRAIEKELRKAKK